MATPDHSCLFCRKALAYASAVFCGAACCAEWEMGKRPSQRTPDSPVMARASIRGPLEILRDERRTMLDYLRLRLSLNDMHGVQDAASDIREIDAKLGLLASLGESR